MFSAVESLRYCPSGRAVIVRTVSGEEHEQSVADAESGRKVIDALLDNMAQEASI